MRNNDLIVHHTWLMIKMDASGTSSKINQIEAKYRKLLDSTNDALLITDMLTGKLLEVNRQASRWLGYSREELMALTYDEIAIPLETLKNKALLEEISSSGNIIFEQDFRTKEGKIISAEVSSRLFTFEGHRAILNFARDITRRKQTESAERHQRKLAEALRDTAATLSTTLDIDEVMQRTLEYVTKVVLGEAVNIMLIANGKARVATQLGYEGYRTPGWEKKALDINGTPTLKWISDNKKPLLIKNVQEFEGWNNQDDSPTQSYIGAPIISKNEIIGFLNLEHHKIYQFDEQDAENLQIFANHAGIAIQNARLHQEIQQYVGELEARVTQRTQELSETNKRLQEEIDERNRIENILKDERNLLRTVIDHLPDDVYVKNRSGHLILTNRALEDRLKPYLNEGENVIGSTDDRFMPQEQVQERREFERHLFETGKAIVNQEVTITVIDGTKRIHLATKIPMHDANGEIHAFVGINRDVTALRHADAALAEERNLLRSLIDNIPDEIYVKDLEGRIILANRALIRRIGHTAPDGEVIGSTEFDYLSETFKYEEAQEIYHREQTMMQSESSPIHREFLLPAEQRWMLTTKVPLYDSQKHVMGLVGVNHDITELKQAEERLTHIIAGAYCLLWYAIVEESEDDDLKWDFYITNEGAAQRFLPLDIPPGETYATIWWKSLFPEDVPMMDNNSLQAIRNGSPGYHHEFRCRQADGKLRWLREETQIKPLTPGRYSVVGICTDITERKEAESTLQRANELLELHVQERTLELSEANESLLDQIAERNRAEQAEREQRILAEALSASAAALSETLEMNEVLDRILAYVARVIPNHENATIMMLEDEIFVRIIRQRDYDDGEGLPIPNQHNLGRIYLESIPILKHIFINDLPLIIQDTFTYANWMVFNELDWIRSYLGVPIHAEGRIIGFINLSSKYPDQFIDAHAVRLLAFSHQAGIAIQNARLFDAVRSHATELRHRVAERTKELEHERAQLAAILNAMTDGVIYYDDQHHALYINQALATLTGYAAHEWVDAIDGWPGDLVSEEVRHQLAITAQARVNRHGIWRGEIKMNRKQGEVFDAQLVTTVVTGTDGYPAGAVTVIRDVSAEKRLEAQKARFIATASHELRTPITNLKTRLYLIGKQPEKLNQHLDIMTSVTDRMRRLVDDLLDVSRFEHGIISLQVVETVLQNMLMSVISVQEPEADKKNIQLHYDLPEDPLYIRADPSRMLQVFTNLITNAINYTLNNGSIKIVVKTDMAINRAVIEISDTGIGIPENLLPEVFKPFFRVHEHNNGVGLGLSITKEIVELHHGEIQLESVLNKGTTFIIKMPLSKPSQGL